MIYDRIRKVAKERELTIKQLEEEAGLGNGTLRRWNNTSPSIDNLIKVAKILSVSVDALLPNYQGKEKK